jgi:hypothetical protein
MARTRQNQDQQQHPRCHADRGRSNAWVARYRSEPLSEAERNAEGRSRALSPAPKAQPTGPNTQDSAQVAIGVRSIRPAAISLRRIEYATIIESR